MNGGEGEEGRCWRRSVAGGGKTNDRNECMEQDQGLQGSPEPTLWCLDWVPAQDMPKQAPGLMLGPGASQGAE